MASVIFVHGIAVKQPEYDKTFQIIQTEINAKRPDIKVIRCFWGELGARLNAGGDSIPKYDETLALDVDSEDPEIVLWE